MTPSGHSDAAFETVMEAHLLQNGCVSTGREGFGCDWVISLDTVRTFVRESLSLARGRVRLEVDAWADGKPVILLRVRGEPSELYRCDKVICRWPRCPLKEAVLLSGDSDFGHLEDMWREFIYVSQRGES